MKEFLNNLKHAWKYTKDQKSLLIKFIISNLIEIGINIVIPILSAKIIIALTSNDFYQIIFIALVIFIVGVLRSVVRYFSDNYVQIIYKESFSNIQTDLGRTILTLENKTIDDNVSGLFIQRLTSDTSRMADIFNLLGYYISNFLMNIGILVAVFIINKIAFVYFIILLTVLFIIEKIRTNKMNKYDKIEREKNEKVYSFVGEIVRGSKDIKMLNSETSFINELHNKIVESNQSRYNYSHVRTSYNMLRSIVHEIGDFALIILLVVLIINNHIAAATALVIHNYSGNLTSLIHWVGQWLELIKSFNLSSSRIYEIINGSTFKKEKFGKMHLEKVHGDFEFKNVTFSYDKNKVLEDLSFKIKANETVAFVGKSGAGKTTIFNLLSKMYDIKKGEILIDGINIKKLDRESIRGNITIISQNPYIFNLSIRDNLKLVKENLTEEEMIDACKIACLHDFVMKLPEKYDTIIGEGGVNLSGGQKQRLAIARALVQKTEIILFDEATSALDNETQENIQKAIENMKNEYTILIIAHRLSTIVNSDRILLLNEGKIIAQGNHKSLLKKSKVYRQLYESEIKK